jgi:TldD protein
VEQARANRAAQRRPVELAPLDWTGRGEWSTPISVDPYDIPIEDKVELLLAANRAATAVAGVAFTNSQMAFIRDQKFFASTDDVVTDQTIYRATCGMNVTAISDDRSDFQSRSSAELSPRGLGYEHVTNADLIAQAPRGGPRRRCRSSRPSRSSPAATTSILRPSHLWLTIHEAIAHPTELDRIMGFEANYAGTSFISSPGGVPGLVPLRPRVHEHPGGALHPHRPLHRGLGRRRRAPRRVPDRQGRRAQRPPDHPGAGALARGLVFSSQGVPVRSHGNSYSQSWEDVAFQRMPNVNLLPNADADVSEEELIADVENGILIDGNGSFSIDQQRYNAQFGGQVFYEIKDGRVTGQLKDVAYQIRTPEFWAALDGLGGESTYDLGGSFGDGKGQPAQSNSISHGCPTTRHRDVTVINTGRRA